jgi:mannose-1-phosphate guanylyltransferase
MQPRDLWAVVLAGGEGVRLRALTRLICGDERPKQYVPLLGPLTLLEETLGRVARLVPPQRIVIVGHERQARYHEALGVGRGGLTVLLQPEDRGTAAAILLATHWILRRDPEALLAVFPSDHFVLEQELFVDCVRSAASASSTLEGRMVLLGAHPTEADSQYGWIEPGPLVAPDVQGVHAVHRFWEKPAPATAAACLASGCLWNTFVLVGGARVIADTGREAVPELEFRLRRAGQFAGGELERWALRHAYAYAPRADFSRAVLQRLPQALAVLRMPPRLYWSDLGTPERVVRTVKALGLDVPWLAAFERSA